MRGWFALKFENIEKLYWVSKNHWYIEQAPIQFKRWTPLFHLEREQLGVGLIWLRLSGLLIHLWTKDISRCIGDDLCKYMDYDKSSLETGIMTCSRVLVSLDTNDGLVANIILKYNGYNQ